MTDGNRWSGRMRRYARVGTSMGGVAAKMATGRMGGGPLDLLAQASGLRDALGGLKGPLMKAAQILSMVPDLLPREYADQLAELQTNAPPMGWNFVKRRMAAELGDDWQDRFARFEKQSAAAASLGQVHRAVDHDGRTLACKLQYPDMDSIVEADLKQLNWVFSLWRRYDRAIDPSEIHKELAARLREELDYEREARHICLYDRMLADEPGVHVPESVFDLSTRRLLTMTWLDGAPLVDFVEHHAELRNTVAENMFRAWYVPFYRYGVIHGDPHLGNYTVRPDGSINLLDFGCIRVFGAPFAQAVIDLYRALEEDDRDLAVKAYETWGFTNLNEEVLETLNWWAEYIYGPLLENRKRAIDEAGGTRYGAEVANKVHRRLHELGGVTPPREFVLMDRAAIGLGSVFMRLKAEINWHELFHSIVDDFDADALQRRQTEALQACGLELPE